MRRLSRNIVVWILGGLAGCISASSGKPDTGSLSRTELLYVISGGWHTEIGLPVGRSWSVCGSEGRISGRTLPCLRLGCARLLHSSKSRDRGYSRALAPGPAVMLVIPLQMSPEVFFGRSNVVVIHVSPDGIERLSEHLWSYLAIDKERLPRRIGTGPSPQSIFYASTACAAGC